MTTRPKRAIPALMLLGLVAGCGREDDLTGQPPEMPVFAEEGLVAGRATWMGTCRNCHLLGIAGAPAVTNFPEWERRLLRGKPALYASALGGIKDEDGTYRMPPHGGNARLFAGAGPQRGRLHGGGARAAPRGHALMGGGLMSGRANPGALPATGTRHRTSHLPLERRQ